MLVLDNVNLLDKEMNNYAALGSFDGLHLGHLSLINKVKELAAKNNGKSMVFTFKNHPRTIIMPKSKLDLLMTNTEKEDVLSKEEIDVLVFKNFDKDIMKMDPERFVEWLCTSYSIKGIVVGFNFRFGYKNLGDVKLLEKLQDRYHYELWVMEPYIFEEEVVSSTRIRKELLEGEITQANIMLSRPYSIEGTVIHGKKLGRTIGFPTANVSVDKSKIIPAVGVYFSNVKINGKYFKGITSVGHNPTVNGKELTIETYILDYDCNIYGETITIYFIDRIRDEMKFKGLEELASQLEKDKNYAVKRRLFLDKS